MAVRIRVQLFVDQVGEGVSSVLMGQSQSMNPGAGPLGAAGPMTVGNAQTLYLQDAESVPGTDGALTVANFNTALVAAANSFAGASGTPLITAALLAQINAWNTGNP